MFCIRPRVSGVDILKKIFSSLIISAVLLSGFSGCKEEPAAETAVSATSSGSISAAYPEEETSAPVESFFGEEYDPFAEDYDPYGGNGAPSPAISARTETKAAEVETFGTTRTEAPFDPAESEPPATMAKAEEPAPAANVAAVTASVASGSAKPAQTSGGITLSLNISNSWESGGSEFIQLDGTVSSGQNAGISGWTAKIRADKSVAADQSWNCGISISGGVIAVTPVSYNSDIQAGGSVTFGMILKDAGDMDFSASSVTAGTITSQGSGSANSGAGNGSAGNNSIEIIRAKDVPPPTADDWLSVKGNKIVDKSGKEVWLAGVNWFGYNTGTNTFDGLWACDLNASVAAIADRGFNLLRIPISAELIKQWSSGQYPTANFNQATNSYLVGMNSLEIFDYIIGQCRANGIKIMIDIHSAKTDAMGHMKPLWSDGNITEEDFIGALGWMAKRYKSDDAIIAYDLKNEPHGKPNESPCAKWDGSKDADNWKYIAEKAAGAVLANNPNVLIMVEGIEIYPKDINENGDFSSKSDSDYHYNWWGGNLRGVRDNPVNLGKYQNKLVYSPHDYGPAVYEQPWFKGGFTYESLYEDCWYDNWLYIQEEGISPLLIGEWGGFMREPNLKWMTYLRKLIKDKRIHHTFWCFNSNSGDTGGLVLDDFKTWDEEKYGFVKEVLWIQNGKFVGLDHEIPLGKNGITLSEANTNMR